MNYFKFLFQIAALCVALTATNALRAEAVVSEKVISEIKAGLLAHDVPDLWSGFQAEGGGIDLHGEVRFRHVDWLFGDNAFLFSLAPAVGATINTSGKTSKLYFDVMKIQVGRARPGDNQRGLFLSVGLGVAVHDGAVSAKFIRQNRRIVETTSDHKLLGSRALFHIPIEIGYQFRPHSTLSVYFEHVSNAFTAPENEGLDSIGLRYGYRF